MRFYTKRFTLALKDNTSNLTSEVATKQNLVIRNANAPGAPVIDATNNARTIFGVSLVDVSLYFNLFPPSHPKQNQIQVSIYLSDCHI